MKKLALSIIILFSFFSTANSHVKHYAKYTFLEYELFRNNQSIGYHKYNFIRESEKLSVKSEVEFKITKLGVDLYKYFAKSEENYMNDIFESYSSKTKQNKKDRYVNIDFDKKGKKLLIDGSSYKGNADKNFIVGKLFTTNNNDFVKGFVKNDILSTLPSKVNEYKVDGYFAVLLKNC